MGYHTLIGDMGTVLSGGQKQRVLIARALYHRPRILLLDEATSHLDVQRERAVNTAIKATNMTRVIVAHRPETIRSADRVIALDKGKVVKDFQVMADDVEYPRLGHQDARIEQYARSSGDSARSPVSSPPNTKATLCGATATDASLRKTRSLAGLRDQSSHHGGTRMMWSYP